ncbi:MAG: RNA polymerase sigma-70 factor [Breznakibacter sp.]
MVGTDTSEQLWKGGDAAFEELFSNYYTRLVVFAVKYVNDEDTAREMVQDVFVALYEKRDSLQIHTSVKSHLYQSVRNRCLNHIKREKLVKGHHDQIQISQKNDEAFFDQNVETTEFENSVFGLIRSLPEKCRQIFEMSRFEGIKNDDIANQLNISKRTVETQISKALRFLRDNWPETLVPILWVVLYHVVPGIV